MYTQCSECLTVYSADAALIARGHGLVQCVHCSAVFDALHTLCEQLPPEPFEHLPVRKIEAQPPQLGVPVYRPNPSYHSLSFDPDDKPRHRQTRFSGSLPGFARNHTARRPSRRWPWVVGTATLSLSLAAQLAYAERAVLLNHTALRPWLDRACASLSCELPPRRDTSQLQMQSRDIRPHPSVPGALIVSATLRNTADFVQAFPVVEITLSDLDENRVAMRRFSPREYLGDARSTTAGIAAGASAALVFEVQDPGKNAVAFEFNFL